MQRHALSQQALLVLQGPELLPVWSQSAPGSCTEIQLLMIWRASFLWLSTAGIFSRPGNSSKGGEGRRLKMLTHTRLRTGQMLGKGFLFLPRVDNDWSSSCDKHSKYVCCSVILLLMYLLDICSRNLQWWKEKLSKYEAECRESNEIVSNLLRENYMPTYFLQSKDLAFSHH